MYFTPSTNQDILEIFQKVKKVSRVSTKSHCSANNIMRSQCIEKKNLTPDLGVKPKKKKRVQIDPFHNEDSHLDNARL